MALLTKHGVRLLVDVRRFPGSRRYPHFNREHLAESLAAAGIDYLWLETLGGRRSAVAKQAPSTNAGLRNVSFRNYADYMASGTFRDAVEALRHGDHARPPAIMCSEGLFWRCHRRLISDYLLAQGENVVHILPDGKLQPHELTFGAQIVDGGVIYPPASAANSEDPTLFDK